MLKIEFRKSIIPVLQIITISLFLGCATSNTDMASIESDNLKEIPKSDTIALESLSILPGDSICKNYYSLKLQLYTGKAIEYEMANDGKWSFIYTFRNGVMQRLDVFGINGYQHRFVEMENGYECHTLMFHRNGNRYLEQFCDKDKKPKGIWKRWHESGELEWEKDYN